MTRVGTDVTMRRYDDADEARVLDLLNIALGAGPAGSRPAEFYRWKHLQNPFGRSYMLVAETDGRIVGFRAFMRWRFVAGDRTLRAVRAVDTATHPDHQGRGIFSHLTRRAMEDLQDEADLIFNTPNEKSLPGYLKMGWAVVGRIPIYVRVRRPVRFARHAWDSRRPEGVATVVPEVDAIRAGEVLDEAGIGELVEAGERFAGISTPRSLEYLRWRYGEAPLLDYRAVWEPGRAVAIFRVRPRGVLVEATVSELITRIGDRAAAQRVLRRVVRLSGADHLSCSFPVGSTAMSAARRVGFFRVPGGITLVANPFGHQLVPDPLLRSAWAPSVGDLEVF